MVIRALFGGAAMVGCFCSVKYLDISTANCIIMTNPMFVAIVCYFWIGEKLGKIDILSIVLAFLGVVLVNDPFQWV